MSTVNKKTPEHLNHKNTNNNTKHKTFSIALQTIPAHLATQQALQQQQQLIVYYTATCHPHPATHPLLAHSSFIHSFITPHSPKGNRHKQISSGSNTILNVFDRSYRSARSNLPTRSGCRAGTICREE